MAQVNPSTIKAVGFDLGGVLLSSERQIFYRYAQEAFGAPMDEITTAITEHVPALERGDIDIAEFWRRVTGALGVDFVPERDLELWRKHYAANTPIHRELLALADRLRKFGYKTAILSNTHLEHVEINQHRHIFEHFDVALMSNQIHAAKPEAKAYLSLCQALGLLPSEIVFIDDLAENVTGAQAVGMAAIEYHGYQELIMELHSLKIKTD